jgi:AcrR family transcriptional regulator
MGVAERKEREKQEMRKLILKAAKKLFVEEGYEKVNIRNIAQEIEYSVGTIYLYFKDKDEILHELHTEGFDELYRRQQTTLAIQNPLERLRKHGEIYVRFGLENPDYYDLMFISLSQAKKIQEKQEWVVGQRTYEFLEQNIRDCIDADYIAEKDFEAATFAMWSLVHGIVSLITRRRVLMCPPEDMDRLIEDTLDFGINQIRSRREQVTS